MKNYNIILITIDCLRSDFLGCIGNNRNITPNIDKFAKKGVIFKNAISNGPSTPFSFPSIFSSSYPLMNPDFPKLSPTISSFPEILMKNGITTIGYNTNPWLSKFYNYNKGFKYYFDLLSNSWFDNSKRRNKLIGKALDFFDKKFKLFLKKCSIDLFLRYKYMFNTPYERIRSINQDIIKRMRNFNSQFFLWIHYMDTHHPFLPPKKFRRGSRSDMLNAEKSIMFSSNNYNIINVKNMYIDSIRYVDSELGTFFKELKKQNKFKNTLFIITADHGEEFKEHGDFSHYAKLYEELINVPLIFRGPKIIEDKISNKLVSLIDIPPSILKYLNLEVPNDYLGKNLVPIMTKKMEKEYNGRDGVYSETMYDNSKNNNRVSLSLKRGNQILSYRTNNWKLILDVNKDRGELYNINKDKEEQNNLIKKEKEVYNNLKLKIEDFLKYEEKKRLQFKKRKKIKKTIKKIFT